MTTAEFAKLNSLQGDILFIEYTSGYSLQAIYLRCNPTSAIIMVCPSGTNTSKMDYLRDIKAIIKIED